MARPARMDTLSEIRRMEPTNAYGKRTIAGTTTQLPERRTRKWNDSATAFTHRTPNGVYDPYTFFQLVHELAMLEPNRPFNARMLADWLNAKRPSFIWDAVTVGRMLNDLMESFRDALNPDDQPLTTTKSWNGNRYQTVAHPGARAALFNLLDDLIQLCTQLQQAELLNARVKRLTSPLGTCPSLTANLRHATA